MNVIDSNSLLVKYTNPVSSQFSCRMFCYTSFFILYPCILGTFHLSHLSASTISSVAARIMTCQCFLPSQSSSGFLPYPLSPGLTISALVCLDFTFHSILYLQYLSRGLIFIPLLHMSKPLGIQYIYIHYET